MTSRQEEIKKFLIEEINKGSKSVASAASQHFGISRQAVNRYLKQLVAEGIVLAQGSTKNRKYSLKVLIDSSFKFQLSQDLHEDKIWRDQVRPLLEGCSENVIGICQYGFTEILNNAIDHSESKDVFITVERTPAQITLRIRDLGVGIFYKIKREFNLDDERHSILELSKGKLTTDASRHTGEGIFFTSRVFDYFAILSGNLYFGYSPDGGDWLLEDKEALIGTGVTMRISSFSQRTLKEVFDRYASGKEDYGFSKTHVPVDLVRYGDENLVSRSQAKRLVSRLERFKQIILDFKGVNMIGQAFADEIFRVFQNEHPDVNFISINTNAEVENMINRIKSQNVGST